MPEADDWSEEQRLAGEYSVLGFYISGHPLDKYAGRLKDLNAAELASMEGRKNNEDIVVAGIIVQIRPMRSRRGARWAILTLQDRTGVIEALAFPEAFAKLEPILKANTPLLVKGRVAVEDVGTRLIVSDARLLDQVADRAAQPVARSRGPQYGGYRRSRPAAKTILQQARPLPRHIRSGKERRHRSDAGSRQRGLGRSRTGRARPRDLWYRLRGAGSIRPSCYPPGSAYYVPAGK